MHVQQCQNACVLGAVVLMMVVVDLVPGSRLLITCGLR